MDMDDDTHQKYLMACKRAHKLEESIQPQRSPFPQEEQKDNKSPSHDSDDDFIPILSKATKALKQQAIHEACTMEHSVPIFIGFMQPKLTKVELSTHPGYIPVFIFLQVALPKKSLKHLHMDFAEASQAPPRIGKSYTLTSL